MTFEYTLLDGVNDSRGGRAAAGAPAAGLRAKVNLIPFNEWPGAAFRRPGPSASSRSSGRPRRGLTATIRSSTGDDVGAGCGELAS